MGEIATVAPEIAPYLARPLPLTRAEAVRDASVLQLSQDKLFVAAKHPKAAWSGLLLRAGCWDESHEVSQDIASPEGSYWHGIAHRMEPDDFNAGYWFRAVGSHSIFPQLHSEALAVLAEHSTAWKLGARWEPLLFIEWCNEARKSPGSEAARAAVRIQEAEWNLLFRFCTLH